MDNILDLVAGSQTVSQPNTENAQLRAEWEAFENRRGPRFEHEPKTFEEFVEAKRLLKEGIAEVEQLLKSGGEPTNG